MEILVHVACLWLRIMCSTQYISSNVHVIMQEAAKSAGRHISVLRSAGAAPDHPIDPGYPEGAYLKNLLLLVR